MKTETADAPKNFGNFSMFISETSYKDFICLYVWFLAMQMAEVCLKSWN